MGLGFGGFRVGRVWGVKRVKGVQGSYGLGLAGFVFLLFVAPCLASASPEKVCKKFRVWAYLDPPCTPGWGLWGLST